MNLLLKTLITGIRELAEKKGIVHFRVDHKRNARGELVIALIISDKEGPLSPSNVP